MKSLANIAHKYYCPKCSKYIHVVLPHYEQRPFDIFCVKCDSELKYKGSTDTRVTSTGNCQYYSLEKQAAVNKKNIGTSAYEDMARADPIYNYRGKCKEESKDFWWRRNLEDPSKPLDLSKVKDVNKYIETGETN